MEELKTLLSEKEDEILKKEGLVAKQLDEIQEKDK